MKRANHPRYVEAVQAYLDGNLAKARQAISQRELSMSESYLVEARVLIKEGNFLQAQLVLERVAADKNPFLSAEQAFVQGSHAFFSGDFEKAALYNLQAHTRYAQCEDRRGEFLSLYNVSVDYQRLGLLKISDRYLALAEAKAERSDEKIAVYRAIACQYGKTGDFDEACRWIERCFKETDDLLPSDRAALQTIAADIFFRAGKVERAAQCLREVSGSKSKLREKARAHFALSLMESWISGEALGPAPDSFKNSPEYRLKWDLLRAVQGGERERSEELWKQLVASEPGTFAPDFRCLIEAEEKDIFFAYLTKIRSLSVISAPTQKLPGKTGKLYEILSQAGTPVRRAELIEAIWEVPYDPSYDARFYKLIERFRKLCDRRLHCKNHAYSLS